MYANYPTVDVTCYDDDKIGIITYTADAYELSKKSSFFEMHFNVNGIKPIDLTIPTDGNEPLSPVVTDSILKMFVRDDTLSISDVKSFMKGFIALGPKDYAWELLDDKISNCILHWRHFLRKNGSSDGIEVNWSFESEAYDAMDAIVGIVADLSEYQRLMKTKKAFVQLCEKRFHYLYLEVDCPAVQTLIDEAIIGRAKSVYRNTFIGKVMTIRQKRTSKKVKAYWIESDIVDGSRITFVLA